MTDQIMGWLGAKRVPHALIMLDLETLDTVATAKVLQIGAVNILKPHHTFVATINVASQQDYFTTESVETRAFWAKQPQELRDQIFSGEWHIADALRRLAAWFPKDAKVFSYGAAMDVAILDYHYSMHDIPRAWSYRDARCFRTIYEQAKVRMPDLEKATPLIPHNALEDAIAQAITFRRIFERFPEIAY